MHEIQNKTSPCARAGTYCFEFSCGLPSHWEPDLTVVGRPQTWKNTGDLVFLLHALICCVYTFHDKDPVCLCRPLFRQYQVLGSADPFDVPVQLFLQLLLFFQLHESCPAFNSLLLFGKLSAHRTYTQIIHTPYSFMLKINYDLKTRLMCNIFPGKVQHGLFITEKNSTMNKWWAIPFLYRAIEHIHWGWLHASAS